MSEIDDKIAEISKKLNFSIEAHLVESIVSLFNNGVLERRITSPRMTVDHQNFTMTVDQAQSVVFKGREKLIEAQEEIQALQKENEVLKEALEFYADQRNYNYSQEYKLAEYWNDLKDDWDFGGKESVEYNKNKAPLVFGGRRARQALREITTEGEE